MHTMTKLHAHLRSGAGRILVGLRMTCSPIRARMISDTTCAAMGITISAGDPVRALCRRLVNDGFDSSRAMKVWRGQRPIRLIHAIGNPDIHTNLKRGGRGAL
jgi:hypothetical protein